MENTSDLATFQYAVEQANQGHVTTHSHSNWAMLPKELYYRFLCMEEEHKADVHRLISAERSIIFEPSDNGNLATAIKRIMSELKAYKDIAENNERLIMDLDIQCDINNDRLQEIERYRAVIKDLLAEKSGQPKSCEHPYDCICASEEAQKLLKGA